MTNVGIPQRKDWKTDQTCAMYISVLINHHIIIPMQTSHGVKSNAFGYALYIDCSNLFFRGTDYEPLDYEGLQTLYNMLLNVKPNEWKSCIKDLVATRRSQKVLKVTK